MREKGRASDDPRDYPPALKGYGISPRPAGVIRLVSAGYSNKEIAQDLGISVRTVKGHLHAVFLRLGLHSRGVLAGEVQRILREYRDQKRTDHVPANGSAARGKPREGLPHSNGTDQREPRATN